MYKRSGTTKISLGQNQPRLQSWPQPQSQSQSQSQPQSQQLQPQPIKIKLLIDIVKSNDIKSIDDIIEHLKTFNYEKIKVIVVQLACYGSFEVVKYMFKKHFDLFKHILNNDYYGEHTILYTIASHAYDLNIFKYIYENLYSDDMIRKNRNGYNLLHSIASSNNHKLFNYIYSKHPDFLYEKTDTFDPIKKADTFDPINIAIIHNNKDVLELMCNKINKIKISIYLQYAKDKRACDSIITYLTDKCNIKCPFCRTNTSTIIKLYLPDEIEIKCNVCLTQTKDIVTLSCGHLCCSTCAEQLS